MWPFSSPRNPYRETIEAKRTHRADVLKLAPTFSADQHQQYLNATASQVVENIEARTWTASAVLEAYIARAAQVHQVTNCLTEVFFEEAREDARKLDVEFAECGRLRGPLHGVPITVKDMFNVKGFDSTIGCTQWANKPAERDATFVTALRAAGAIIIAKTNVPQALFTFECSNPLWGRTFNPWSTAHSPGGSSGGEGALLAADGSALGFGSDAGGSIRIPSGYCGIFGFKPGHGRVPFAGAVSPNPGFQAVEHVAGPMARSVEDLERVARVLFGERGNGEDYFPAPVPYRDVTLPEKLRFGYYLNDGLVKGSPACHRAVLETVEALRQAGHECVEIEPPDTMRSLQLVIALTSADGSEKLKELLGPDKKELATLAPGFVRGFAGWLIRTFTGDAKFASLLALSHKTSVRRYYDYVADKLAFEREARASLWDDALAAPLDAVLSPVQAIPGLPHGGGIVLAPLICSTIVWNVVDSPVGVVPVTRVDPARDRPSYEWRAAPGNGSKVLEREIYGPKGAYNASAMRGLPVGVQVVGRPWGEEKVLAIMHVIDAILGPRGFGPGSWAPNKQVGGALAMA